jgi:hypothetical protein
VDTRGGGEHGHFENFPARFVRESSKPPSTACATPLLILFMPMRAGGLDKMDTLIHASDQVSTFLHLFVIL